MSSSRTDEPPRAPTAAPGARQASITGSDTRNTQVAQDTQDTQNTEASQDTQSGDLITLWGLPRIVRLRDLERIKENARGNPTPVNLALRSEAHYGLLKPGSFLTMDVVSLGMLILGKCPAQLRYPILAKCFWSMLLRRYHIYGSHDPQCFQAPRHHGGRWCLCSCCGANHALPTKIKIHRLGCAHWLGFPP